MNLASAVGVRLRVCWRPGGTACDRLQVIASWTGTDFGDNFEYDWPARPVRTYSARPLCHYPDSVQQQFPDLLAVVEMEAESYLGIPLVQQQRARRSGLLAIFA